MSEKKCVPLQSNSFTMLFPIKPYIGNFSANSPLHIRHKDYVYEIFFEAILGIASDLSFVKDEMKNAKEKAQKFFNNVDDCVFGGRFQYYRKNGSLNNDPYFLVRVGDKVGVVDEDLNILIDIEYDEIIPPIRTNKPLFVVKNDKNQWQVMEAKTQRILVEFGIYKKYGDMMKITLW